MFDLDKSIKNSENGARTAGAASPFSENSIIDIIASSGARRVIAAAAAAALAVGAAGFASREARLQAPAYSASYRIAELNADAAEAAGSDEIADAATTAGSYESAASEAESAAIKAQASAKAIADAALAGSEKHADAEVQLGETAPAVPKKLAAAVAAKDPEVPQGVSLEEGERLPMLIDIELNSLAAEVEAEMEAQAEYEAMLARGEEIMAYAKTFLGTPYLMGGNSPAAFDCSGYVMYVLHALGYTQPGRSAQDVYNVSERISKEELIPGDLVFFKRSGSSYISHVGFYAGDGKMLHMGTGGCCYTDLTIDYWTSWTYGYGRMAWTAGDEAQEAAETSDAE